MTRFISLVLLTFSLFTLSGCGLLEDDECEENCDCSDLERNRTCPWYYGLRNDIDAGVGESVDESSAAVGEEEAVDRDAEDEHSELL